MRAVAHLECCSKFRFKAKEIVPWTLFINYMKILIAIIVLLIIHFQYRIWVGDGSIAEIDAYQYRLDDLKKQAEEKRQRNEALYAEVLDLRKGQEAIEERAREELGMIKEDETFFHVLEWSDKKRETLWQNRHS